MKKKHKVKSRPAPAALGPNPIVTGQSDTQPAAPLAVTGVRKLDLACGQTPKEGFEGVDCFQGAQHVVDLTQYPWPFEDNSVDELHCSHYIEHIEMVMLDAAGKVVRPGEPGYTAAKDALFMFFDECYRILKPGGWLTVICPAAQNVRAFQDPTHRRFIVAETFQYLWAEWRRANKLDHYNVQCDFSANVGWGVQQEMNAMSAEAQQHRFQHYWNCIYDWMVKLQAHKPAR